MVLTHPEIFPIGWIKMIYRRSRWAPNTTPKSIFYWSAASMTQNWPVYTDQEINQYQNKLSTPNSFFVVVVIQGIWGLPLLFLGWFIPNRLQLHFTTGNEVKGEKKAYFAKRPFLFHFSYLGIQRQEKAINRVGGSDWDVTQTHGKSANISAAKEEVSKKIVYWGFEWHQG